MVEVGCGSVGDASGTVSCSIPKRWLAENSEAASVGGLFISSIFISTGSNVVQPRPRRAAELRRSTEVLFFRRRLRVSCSQGAQVSTDADLLRDLDLDRLFVMTFALTE
jgi:hypothetical protein